MPKKPKFKPEITRVRLNPEQAVLTCNCYFDQGGIGYSGTCVGAGISEVCDSVQSKTGKFTDVSALDTAAS